MYYDSKRKWNTQKQKNTFKVFSSKTRHFGLIHNIFNRKKNFFWFHPFLVTLKNNKLLQLHQDILTVLAGAAFLFLCRSLFLSLSLSFSIILSFALSIYISLPLSPYAALSFFFLVLSRNCFTFSHRFFFHSLFSPSLSLSLFLVPRSVIMCPSALNIFCWSTCGNFTWQ